MNELPMGMFYLKNRINTHNLYNILLATFNGMLLLLPPPK